MRFSLRKAIEHEPTVDPFDGVNNGRPRSLSIPLGFAYQLQSGRTHYPGVSCRSRLAPDAFGRVKSHGPDNGRPSPLCRAPQMFRFPSTRHYRPRSIRLSYNINFVSWHGAVGVYAAFGQRNGAPAKTLPKHRPKNRAIVSAVHSLRILQTSLL